MRRAKHLRLWQSLKYGWRLTRKHFRTLVPGSMLFYAPDLLDLAGCDLNRWAWGVTLWHGLLACGLLWHALQLSDQETRSSRLHQAVLPAPGYLGRFLSSTGLYWGALLLALWPALRTLSGAWWPPDRGQALAWLWRPWAWSGGQLGLAVTGAILALPAGIWCVYGWFHGYYVADEGQSAWPSMRSSFLAVQGAFMKTLSFVAVIGAINALGYALWVVGVFVAFPITLMATTYVHLELKSQTHEAPKGA